MAGGSHRSLPVTAGRWGSSRPLVEAGGAEAFLGEVDSRAPQEPLEPLLGDADLRAAMSRAELKLGRPGAADRLVEAAERPCLGSTATRTAEAGWSRRRANDCRNAVWDSTPRHRWPPRAWAVTRQ